MLKFFSVYDSATAGYFSPFCAPTLGAALRAFLETAKRPDTDLFQHPNDYYLYEIGTFDPQTGEVTSLQTPAKIGSVAQLRLTDKNETNTNAAPN